MNVGSWLILENMCFYYCFNLIVSYVKKFSTAVTVYLTENHSLQIDAGAVASGRNAKIP